MKTTFYCSLLVCVFGITISYNSYGQDNLFDLSYEVNRVLPDISITEGELAEASTVSDLNSYYKSSWVKEYISVNIITFSDGNILQAKSNNNILTPDQKDIMEKADIGRNISVEIRYLPENSLSQKEIKAYDFSFVVDPESEASYIGGEVEMRKYFEKNIMSKIDKSKFQQHKLRAVNFTINPDGQVVDVTLFDTSLYDSSKEVSLEEFLVDKICEMPRWKPAEYSNGQKVSQRLAFSIGDHYSCTVNLLNIRRYASEEN